MTAAGHPGSGDDIGRSGSCAWGATAGRGVRPAAQWLSFASPKESHQRKGDPTRCVPTRPCGRVGQPAVLASSGVSLELAALRQSRALIRWPLRSSAHPEGNPGDLTSTRAMAALRSARPSLRSAKRLRPRGRAKQWPVRLFGVRLFGYSAVQPPAGCACGAAVAGWHVCRRTHLLRGLARRSCLNGARQRAVSSAAHPVTAATQVAP